MTTALRTIFAKPVDRPIDGVIKADDEASLRIELDEYVITDEIGKRLETFLDAYNNYDTANGVWISGFFGSGKSHLLKMLALLMENREIDGTQAFDLFEEKLTGQPMLLGALRKAVSVPSKSILFNIDQKADVISKTDVDALLSVFQKVFDEACGYYGKLPHIAQFERDLDDRGQLAAFKDAYAAAAGKPWERGREQAALERKNIATAFASVTGGDPADAADILGQYRADTRVSIEDFANKVKAWIDKQAPKFRLNFFVDEVGQYIAENVKLMTNLQTIAESLNTKCKGQAWVIVTSQQDMEAIIGDGKAFQSQDFSKIMARFGVKMPLNSADVAEVIQRRLLSKTDEGQVRLGNLHDREENNLKTLFDFTDGSIKLKNFDGRAHFVSSYPFPPYQYMLFQMAITSLYYIAPEETETDFLKITKPEEIRICDPAAGSGHMLTYAFDLLYAIYEEEGYDATEIPALILQHNLTGVEIDDRAGALAAFALAMKAAAKLGRRRFLRMEAKPDIVVLQNVSITSAEMQDVAAVVGKDLFTDELCETLGQFEQAKNFGSLIVPKLRDPAETLRVVKARDFAGDLLLKEVQARVVAVLRMAEALSPKYHVVVANPPYMGGKGMNQSLGDFAKAEFKLGKADLMTCFMERLPMLTQASGTWAMINLPSWMFLSSFEGLRQSFLTTQSVNSFLHLGRGIFGSDFGTVAFCVRNKPPHKETKGHYRRLFKNHVDVRRPTEIERLFLDKGIGSYDARQSDLLKLPGTPISYWATPAVYDSFDGPNIASLSVSEGQNKTANNDRFVRQHWEVNSNTKGIDGKWLSYAKGGDFRRWYGNRDHVVDWSQPARNHYRKDNSARIIPEKLWYLKGVTWTLLTSFKPSFRLLSEDETFDMTGSSVFIDDDTNRNFAISLLNSKVSELIFGLLNPTLALQIENVKSLPIKSGMPVAAQENCAAAIRFGKSDWDAYETSWDFTTLPLLSPDHRGATLADSYATLRAHWQSMTDEMKALEEENNRIFINAYGLQDELTPEVPIEEITLTCNPAYRYGVKGSEDDRETRLRADTMAEFLSYAVGCMFGRYSLDAEGLILANQGERLEDYLARIPEPSFMPDEDNVIPVLDGDWFPDDITERFRLFLRTTFGETHFRENLRYIEDALGKDIRKYFTKDFYADHVKRYKKRPIYWMFSSPKGTFNALIYMHRYRPDTVSVLLNDYLREFISKLEGERGRLEKLSDDPSASQGQRTKALKDMAVIAKQIDELNEWERDVVFPLAQAKIEIDLDDGVKANYPKFGEALKKIPGLETKDD